MSPRRRPMRARQRPQIRCRAPPEAPVKPPMDPVDRDTLIRTVNGEAGREPIDGQAAVVHVILNRLAAGGYGKLDHQYRQSAGARPRRSTGLP